MKKLFLAALVLSIGAASCRKAELPAPLTPPAGAASKIGPSERVDTYPGQAKVLADDQKPI